MPFSKQRRQFLLAAATVPLAASWATPLRQPAIKTFEDLEKELGGRLGVCAINTANQRRLSYRGAERFPLCSTFKLMAAAAILDQAARTPGLLEQRIAFRREDLVNYSPVTEQHLSDGMTLAALCAAALQYSDNTAANLLLSQLEGPSGLTRFARRIGDTAFRLDRREPELNTAIPGDPRDTTTPDAMAATLEKLVLGNVLARAGREQLQAWLRGNTTGAQKIKAGLPADWQIGDKTGSGNYGTANDVAFLIPPNRAPVMLAIYTTHRDLHAEARNDIIAQATRRVVAWLAEN